MTDWQFPALALAIHTMTALVFLAAALGKMRNWEVLQGVIANYRLLPEFLVVPVAFILPPLEAVLGLALLSGITSPWSDIVGISLLLLFAVAMGINIARGRRSIDCGCFQSTLKQSLSWTLVVRNGLMAGALGVAMLTLGETIDITSLVNGLLGGVVLFITLQSLNILVSIVPAWQKPHMHGAGSGQ